MTVLAAILLLVIIMDPIGNVPVFLSILKNIPMERRKIIIIRELIIAFLILIFFMFVGRFLLQLLQIEQSSLGIAGGIILFIIAIRMIFPGKIILIAMIKSMIPVSYTHLTLPTILRV